MNVSKLFMVLSASCLLAACSVGARPADPVSGLPSAWPAGTVGTGETVRWWVGFGCPSMTRLVDRALSSSASVKAARERLVAAKAAAGAVAGNSLPKVSGSAGWSHSRSGRTGEPGSSAISEKHSLSLSASYEVDAWGRAAAAGSAAESSVLAAEDDLAQVRQDLAETVCILYVSIVGGTERARFLGEESLAARSLAESARRDFAFGIGTYDDLLSRIRAADAAETASSKAKGDLSVLRRALSAACGTTDDVFPDGGGWPSMAPLPDGDVPVEAISARPDVRAAWNRVLAAHFAADEAEAARFPVFSVNPSAGYSGTMLASVFDNWALSLAGNLAATLFDGGAAKRASEQARAKAEAAAFDYAGTVLSAYAQALDRMEEDRVAGMVLADAEKAAADAARREAVAVADASSGAGTALDAIARAKARASALATLAASRAEALAARMATYGAFGGNAGDDGPEEKGNFK